MSRPDPDHAQVIISSPLGRLAMESLLTRLDLLFRINPFYHIKEWRVTGGRARLDLKNMQNQQHLQCDVDIERQQQGVTLYYSTGIKAFTRFALVEDPQGCKLHITEDYSRVAAAERTQRLHEVDQTLLPWAHALKRYFGQYRRWSWLPGWHGLQDFWFAMPPNQRLVCRIIIWASLIEFVIFLILWVQYH